jgi:linoleoyl-CoA desaturase
MFDLDLGDHIRDKRQMSDEKKAEVRVTLAKARRQLTKDFVLWPLLSGPSFRHTLTANLTACALRNVWSHSVIMCGHFPEGVETFELEVLREDETKGEWYVRQMLGSADISGSPFMHLMTGNLSHQIEHHCFPDLPSNRYREIAPQVEDLFERYGLSYNTRPLVRQVGSAWHRVVRLSFPNGWLEETDRHNLGSQLRKLARAVRKQPPA